MVVIGAVVENYDGAGELMQMRADDGRQQTVLQAVVAALRSARRVLVITGAGISADSGLPTYRGIGGLYESGQTEDDVPIEVALSGEMMLRRPELTWKYLSQVEQACRGAGFNAAHQALAQLAPRFERFTVLTQNIDGFHLDAGQPDVIEIHGSFRQLYCVACQRRWRVQDYAALRPPPICDHCCGMVRPDVVLFGEMLPTPAVTRLQACLSAPLDLVMSIGTTSVFPYISGSVENAARAGVPTVEINPGDSDVSDLVQHRLKMRAAEALPQINALLKAEAA
ncbi:MAG: NAD-dependent protein deacylase [Panacagrimonas sp.]